VRIIVVSGLSGSGKSVALHMLEDLGFYCIDNIPAAMLKPFISYTVRSPEGTYRRTAVGLDARNTAAEIATVPKLIDELKRSGLECEMLFLVTHEDELLRRFAETRRKHPMSSAQMDLRASIAMERELLEPLTNAADLIIDTSAMSVHTLRDFIQHRVDRRVKGRLSVVFESFGFKHGIPGDADFVFDARSLPNPYWEPSLRPLTGQDPPVVKFLQERQDAARLIDDIVRFLDGRIPEYERDHRNYLTVAIGCTGGQHRSVYIAERLAEHFAARAGNVLVRHTHLPEKKHS
jgi:RNase adapter protein RapZ